MIRAEPTLTRAGHDRWFGQYCTGRFWHTVRDDNGRAAVFKTERGAMQAARDGWWRHVNPTKRERAA